MVFVSSWLNGLQPSLRIFKSSTCKWLFDPGTTKVSDGFPDCFVALLDSIGNWHPIRFPADLWSSFDS